MVWQSNPSSWHSNCKGPEIGVSLGCPPSGKKHMWPKCWNWDLVVDTARLCRGNQRFILRTVVFKQESDSLLMSCGEWIRGAGMAAMMLEPSWMPLLGSSFPAQ